MTGDNQIENHEQYVKKYQEALAEFTDEIRTLKRCLTSILRSQWVRMADSQAEIKFIEAWAEMLNHRHGPIAEVKDYEWEWLANMQPQLQTNVFRIDFAFPAAGLGVEIDGHNFHSSREQRRGDAQRDRALLMDGWSMMRFTGTEIEADATACAHEVARIVLMRMRERSASVDV